MRSQSYGGAGIVTLFEKIIAREVPADIVHEDAHCIVIRDIDPQAPVHLLIIPKTMIPRVGEATLDHQMLLGHLLLTAGAIAREHDFVNEGFRLVINHGADGGEVVPHLHVHVLAGRAMQCPPG